MTIPGTLVSIQQHGVLIIGESGSGKSELALALIDRHHQLVSDDAVVLTLSTNGTLVGSCPHVLQDLLELKTASVINVRKHYGEHAIARSVCVNKIVQLGEHHTLINAEKLTAPFPEIQQLVKQLPIHRLPKKSADELAHMVETFVSQQPAELSI